MKTNGKVMKKNRFSGKNKYKSINYMDAYEDDNYLIQIIRKTKKNLSDRKTIVYKVNLKKLLDKIYEEIRFQNDPVIKKIKQENDNFTTEYKPLSEQFQKTCNKIFTDVINTYQARGYKRPNLSYEHNLFKINALLEESTEKIEQDFETAPLNKNLDPRFTPANKTIAYLRKLNHMVHTRQSKEENHDDFSSKLSIPKIRRKSIINYINDRNQKLRDSIQSLKNFIESDAMKNIDDFPKKSKFFIANRNVCRERTSCISRTKAKLTNLARSRRQSFNSTSLLMIPDSKFKMLENNLNDKNNNVDDFTKKKLIDPEKISESTDTKKILITPECQTKKANVDKLILNSSKDFDNKTICNKKKVDRNAPKFLSSTKINFTYDKTLPKPLIERNTSDTSQKKPKKVPKIIESSIPFIKQNSKIVSTTNIRSHINLRKNSFSRNKKNIKYRNTEIKNNLFIKTETQDKGNGFFLIKKKLNFDNNPSNCNDLSTPEKQKKEFIINAYKKLSKGNIKNIEGILRKYLRDIKGLDTEGQDNALLEYSYKNAKNNLKELDEKILDRDIGKKTERIYLNNHIIKRISPMLNLMKEKEKNIERLEKYYEVNSK